MSPGLTDVPVAGFEVFATELAGDSGCSVSHPAVQPGSGSPPGGVVGTTTLPTEPVAPASTVAL